MLISYRESLVTAADLLADQLLHGVVQLIGAVLFGGVARVGDDPPEVSAVAVLGEFAQLLVVRAVVEGQRFGASVALGAPRREDRCPHSLDWRPLFLAAHQRRRCPVDLLVLLRGPLDPHHQMHDLEIGAAGEAAPSRPASPR